MALIEFPQRGGESRYQVFGQGGSLFQNNRLVLLFLGVLNAVLFIATIAIAVSCAKVNQRSVQVSHSAVENLMSELEDLRGNHSEIITAKGAAQVELVETRQHFAQMKLKIQDLKTHNDIFRKQIVAIQAQKSALKANISILDASCGKCLTGWTIFNNSCYFFSYTESPTIKMTWPSSRANCIKRGADLVIIDYPQEQFFVSSIIKNKRTSPRWWENGFWIGLTDIETEGRWIWINNVTEVEQRYWKAGEPNNQGPQGEHCGVAIPSNRNPWETRYDGQCHGFTLHWICEMPARENVDWL